MRISLPALALLSAAPASAQTAYYCVPNEPRVTARDRLVSVEIRVLPDGEFDTVVYGAGNGASYDRGSQYRATNTFYNGQYVWIGKLRINQNVGMVGAFHRLNGRLFYVETVHDDHQGGKVISEVVSVCNEPAPQPSNAGPLRTQSNEERAAQALAEADRLTEERKEQEARTEKVALLEKTRDLIRDKMFACVGREGASMVLTDEKAEVVAKAAMIFCHADVDAWVRSSMEIAAEQNGAAANPQGLRDAIEKSALEVVTAYVVKARGEIIRKNINPPPAPAPDAKQAPPA